MGWLGCRRTARFGCEGSGRQRGWLIIHNPLQTLLAAGAAVLTLSGALTACTTSAAAPNPTEVAAPAESPTATTQPAALVPPGAQPRLAGDPAQLADNLVADEVTLRDPAAAEPLRALAARRQQVAYRAIGRHPEWDAVIRPRIPAGLAEVYERNVDARRQLSAMAQPRDTLPAWRIVPPTPAPELLGYYREAEAASGVGWNYLAAINLVETCFGRIAGVSTAGAQGPMQFMPSTWAAYGAGGDVTAPRDSILAAGRFLAASGFGSDPDGAIFRYNNAEQYVRAVTDYAAIIAADPAAFAALHRWEVYYYSTAGDVLLPLGYDQSARIPVADYLASHPQ